MVPGHQWNREFKTVKKIILAAALASVAVPAMAADAYNFAAMSEGIETRYVRGNITKERADEVATVSVTPSGEKWGRYMFTVAVFNKSGAPINIGAENVTAQMLDGTTIAALPSSEIVRIARSRAGWASFATALAGMGNNYNTYSGSGYSSGRVGSTSYSGSTYFSGSSYNATAAAINRQRTDSQLAEIRNGLDSLIANVGENYFSTNTLNDGEGFAGSHRQAEVPQSQGRKDIAPPVHRFGQRRRARLSLPVRSDEVSLAVPTLGKDL